MKAVVWLLVLAGCAAQVAGLPPAPIPVRNPTSLVASQSDANLARLAGDWRIVSAAGMPAGATVRFGADRAEMNGVVLSLTALGPGRIALGDEEIWVHWLDADNRTAALGEPGGKRVWIMDRTGQPGERLAAARKILDWYGYDLSRMEGA